MKIEVTTQWQNIYTLSGFAAGTELAVKPDGQAVFVVVGGLLPTIPIMDGESIQPFEDGVIPSGNTNVWISTFATNTTADIRSPIDAVLTGPFPLGDLVKGKKAMTVQPTNEVGVKLGNSRVLSARLTVGAGNQVYIGFTTGSLPFIIKGREVTQQGSTEVRYSAEEDRSYTGGTVINIRNPNRVTQQPIGISAKHTITPSGTAGTIYLDPASIFGAGGSSASRIGTDVDGLEYVLKPNTSHVFTINNAGNGSADIFWWMTGIEGVPDLLVL